MPRSSAATVFVTTSWDDGDRRDLKIAEMLHSHGLKGTFYVPVQDSFVTPLTNSELRDLSSAGFEIGAHSLSHHVLTRLSEKELVNEIQTCKQSLEQMLGLELRMFCYPNGRYNPVVLSHVQKAGYKGARTTRMLASGLNFTPYKMPTTLQAYPHRPIAYVRSIKAAGSLQTMSARLRDLLRCRNWVDLGKTLFDEVFAAGGMWHLYGHSWEIDSLALWPQLRELLDYVSGVDNAVYVTNNELLGLAATHSLEEKLTSV